MDKSFQTIRTASFDFRWTSGFEPFPVKLHGFEPRYRTGFLECKAGDLHLDLILCDGSWATWMLYDHKNKENEPHQYHGCLSLKPDLTPFLWSQMKKTLLRAGYSEQIASAMREPRKAPWMMQVEPERHGESLADHILSEAVRSCSARLVFFLSSGKFRPV